MKRLQIKLPPFVDLCRGLFFLVSAVSVTAITLMLILVWQPIWTKGFNDFHSISDAIVKLDETAKPASQAIPELLVQIREIRLSVSSMDDTMKAMDSSIEVLEEINPNMIKINYAMEQMNLTMSHQMGNMSYQVGRMGTRLSPFTLMPFNW